MSSRPDTSFFASCLGQIVRKLGSEGVNFDLISAPRSGKEIRNEFETEQVK